MIDIYFSPLVSKVILTNYFWIDSYNIPRLFFI